MKVGAMEESVTVSGQSPVVDITSTSASVAFTKEILENVPRGRDLQNVLAMAPGVTQAQVDVGGSTLAQRQDTASYGMEAQPKLQYRGHEHRDGRRSEHAHLLHRQQPRGGAGPDIRQRRRGFDARRFHGGDHEVGRQHFPWSVSCLVAARQLQASNLNDELKAQNINAPPQLKKFYDVAADLGGRIIRDKLWFYGGYAKQTKSEGTLGFAADAGTRRQVSDRR